MQASTAGGQIFERYERKYLLSRFQFESVLRQLEGSMEQDSYGLHTISTIYYDTGDFDIIRRCLKGPRFKQKLRLRAYGLPGRESTVYLELKKKLSGITYKRRVALPLWKAESYLAGGAPPRERGRAFGEIDWFVRQHPMEPKVLISYDRIALQGIQDPSLRVTFDSGIRWRDSDLRLGHGDRGQPLLEPGSYLMEVKAQGALPLGFVRMLSGLKAYPVSISKYGSIFGKYLTDKEDIAHAV